MEAGSLVACAEDVSSLFPEETLDAKHKVGCPAGIGGDIERGHRRPPNLTAPPSNHDPCLFLGSKQPVFLREKSARGWELLLQSLRLRTSGVGPTQRQGFAKVSYHRPRRHRH